jgi:RNA polymerase sigma-70 factor, ECF subfamily
MAEAESPLLEPSSARRGADALLGGVAPGGFVGRSGAAQGRFINVAVAADASTSAENSTTRRRSHAIRRPTRLPGRCYVSRLAAAGDGIGGSPVYTSQVIRTTVERELVRRALEGSDDAQAELFRRHVRRAWQSAFLVAGSRGLADDATQEGFMAAFAALDRFDGSRPFAPWVGRIVVNRALNLVRAEVRAGLTPSGALPVEWLDTDVVERSSVRAALSLLDPDQRAVVALRYWLDLTGPEVANALQIPLGTVHSRLSRAFETLRTTIEREP